MLDDRVSEGTRLSRRPVITWVLMLSAVVATLVQPRWLANGEIPPFNPWLVMGIPVLLGIAGAFFAVRSRHPWWAVLSGCWGFVLIVIFFVEGVIQRVQPPL